MASHGGHMLAPDAVEMVVGAAKGGCEATEKDGLSTIETGISPVHLAQHFASAATHPVSTPAASTLDDPSSTRYLRDS